ncbi:MAG: DUF4070 domain-containing protein [archaeon]
MATRVLMVYPTYPDTYWSFSNILKFISKKAAFPPLGLITIASMLPERWEKRLVDTNIQELTDEDIGWADMVMVSAMIVQQKSAQSIIDRCKAAGKTVVAGGPAFTTMHERFKNVDHLILNEAESTLPVFLDDLERGEPKPMYTSKERPDINTTPIPMWSLLNMRQYASMAIQYSRGCPFNCEFCDIVIMNGRVPRTKAPDQLVGEMQSLHDAGWRGSVFIVDDNFIGNKTTVKRMLPSIIAWQKMRKYPFSFLTEASTNLADDEDLMKMMSEANFSKVFVGIETPDVDSLKECGKYQNMRRDLAESVRIIQGNGMQVMAGFIVGFDNDKETIFDRQVRFIQQVGIVTAMVGMLSALPQTRLWHRLADENRLLGEFSGENTDGSLNFIPKMGAEKLIEGYKSIISTIYTPKQYYRRIHQFIKNYRPTVRTRLRWQDVHALTRSLWRIGIVSRSRFRYWWLIMRTTFTKIKALPVAIELAILGLHFEMVTRQVVAA